MRFYNVDMKGKFWNQRGAADPATDPSNEGRLFYNETTELLKLHNSTGWDEIVTAGNAPSVIGGDFLRKDQNDSTTYDLGVLGLDAGATVIGTNVVSRNEVWSNIGRFRSGVAGGVSMYSFDELSYLAIIDASRMDYYTNGDVAFTVTAAGNATFKGLTIRAGDGLYTMWHSGNDGAGSGLDADLLDAQSSAYYRNAGNMNAGTLPVGRLTGTYNIDITGTARYA